MNDLLTSTLCRIAVSSPVNLEFQVFGRWISPVIPGTPVKIIGSSCPSDLTGLRVTQLVRSPSWGIARFNRLLATLLIFTTANEALNCLANPTKMGDDFGGVRGMWLPVEWAGGNALTRLRAAKPRSDFTNPGSPSTQGFFL